jgi:hypothetical protein
VHEVYLRVEDRDGKRAMDRRSIYVARPLPALRPAYLPWVSRRR